MARRTTRIWRVSQLAALADRCTKTIFRAIDAGKIKATLQGNEFLISETEVRKYAGLSKNDPLTMPPRPPRPKGYHRPRKG